MKFRRKEPILENGLTLSQMVENYNRALYDLQEHRLELVKKAHELETKRSAGKEYTR